MITDVASKAENKVVVCLCIRGGDIDELKENTMPSVITNACAKVNGKGGTMSVVGSGKKTTTKIMLRTVDFTEFFGKLDDTWITQYSHGEFDTILKVDHMVKEKDSKHRGKLSNGRMVALVQRGQCQLATRFQITYGEGYELISSKPKGELPVFAAAVEVLGRPGEHGMLSITVNPKNFPKHKNAGTAILFGSENDDVRDGNLELQSWVDALALNNVPVLDQAMMDDDLSAYKATNDMTVLKWVHTQVDRGVPSGGLGNRRLMCYYQKGEEAPYNQRYGVFLHEGDTDTFTPKYDLPLYGAAIAKVGSGHSDLAMTITVSKEFFPKHPMAGRPMQIVSELEGGEASEQLEEWKEALKVKGKPIYEGSWPAGYAKAQECEVVMATHIARDASKIKTGYGNRRLIVLRKSTVAGPLKDRYALSLHDGDEKAQGMFTPKSVLPLYGADISFVANKLTVTVNGTHFPGHEKAGKPWEIGAAEPGSDAEKQLGAFPEAMLVKDVDIFPEKGWPRAYSAVTNVEILKHGHTCRDPSATSLQVGNRRLLVLTKAKEVPNLKAGFSLAYHEGDEIGEWEAKDSLPLFGAEISLQGKELTVIVSKTDFPQHAQAGKPFKISSEKAGSTPADLKEWAEALSVKQMPIFEGSWNTQYQKVHGVTIMKDGHAMKDSTKTNGAVGNRRLLCITKAGDGSTLKTRYNLHYHDGDEAGEMTPKASLPLYGAKIELKTMPDQVLSITVNKAEFSGADTTPLLVSSEQIGQAAGKELQEWATAMYVLKQTVFSGSGWSKAYCSANNCKILKEGHVARDPLLTAEAVGNRRFLVLAEASNAVTLKNRYSLNFHDGDAPEASIYEPKGSLPLYAAEVSVVDKQLSVVISSSDFPKHPMAGKPFLVSSEGDGQDLQDWVDALGVKNVPIMEPAYKKAYTVGRKVAILKDGHTCRDTSRPATALGNRRMLVLTQSTEAKSIKDRYAFAYHDGDEADATTPKDVLPLYAAAVTLKDGGFTVTVSKADFPSHPMAGKALQIFSEGGATVLTEWAEALSVKSVPVFGDGWQAEYASTYGGEVVKDLHVLRESTRTPKALGARRLAVIMQKPGILKEQYSLQFHDGDEAGVIGGFPLPLYGAEISVGADKTLVVTVSASHFPKSGTAGKPVTIGLSETGGEDLAAFAAELTLPSTPVLGLKWKAPYGKAKGVEVVREGHSMKDPKMPKTALGNRRLLVLTQNAAAPFKDAFQLSYHDGDEKGDMKPKATLPLYGAGFEVREPSFGLI